VLLDASQGYVEMSALAVHPEHQGQSIGAGLMRHAEQETQVHWGRTELYIEIIPFMQESLVGYYLRNGFLRTDDPPLPFPEPAIVMPEYLDRLQLHRMRKPLGSLPVGEST
jgi:GNAT superfamily N-acetyltransferase